MAAKKKFDFSDLGPGNNKFDFSDLGPAANEQSSDQEPSFLQGMLGRIKQDFAGPSPGQKFLEGAINSPGALISNLGNFGNRLLGRPEQQPLPNLIQESDPNSLLTSAGRASLPTYLAGPIARPIEGAIGALGNIGSKAIGKGAIRQALGKGAGILTRGAATGAATAPLFGADPTEGALYGAGLSSLLHGTVGAATSQPIKKLVLALANRGLNTPEEAYNVLNADRMGQPGVPIGDVSGSQTLKNLWGALGYVPFSGAQKAEQVLHKGVATAKADQAAQSIAENQDKLQNLQENPVSRPIYNDKVSSNARQVVNGLNNSENKAQAAAEFSNRVNKVAEKNKSESAANYKKVDNEQRLDVGKNGISMPEYSNVASELAANAENLRATYGTDSDVDRRVLSELDKAEHFLKTGRKAGFTVGEARERNSALGEAAAAAKQNGDYDTARLLQKIRHAFNNDWHTALSSINPQMAEDLRAANEFHATQVAPFYRAGNIRNAFNGKIVGGGKLANTLLDENNQDIWDMLGREDKDLATHLAITKGKGGSGRGGYEGNASDISSSWNNLTDAAKERILEHRPELHDYFQNLNQALGNQEEVYKGQLFAAKAQQRAQERQSSQLQSQINQLTKQQQQAEEEARLGAPHHGSKISKYAKKTTKAVVPAVLGAASIIHPGILGLAGTSVLGNLLRRAMQDPGVLDAYLSGQKLPERSGHNILKPLLKGAKRGSLAAIFSGTSGGNNGN